MREREREILTEREYEYDYLCVCECVRVCVRVFVCVCLYMNYSTCQRQRRHGQHTCLFEALILRACVNVCVCCVSMFFIPSRPKPCSL